MVGARSPFRSHLGMNDGSRSHVLSHSSITCALLVSMEGRRTTADADLAPKWPTSVRIEVAQPEQVKLGGDKGPVRCVPEGDSVPCRSLVRGSMCRVACLRQGGSMSAKFDPCGLNE